MNHSPPDSPPSGQLHRHQKRRYLRNQSSCHRLLHRDFRHKLAQAIFLDLHRLATALPLQATSLMVTLTGPEVPMARLLRQPFQNRGRNNLYRRAYHHYHQLAQRQRRYRRHQQRYRRQQRHFLKNKPYEFHQRTHPTTGPEQDFMALLKLLPQISKHIHTQKHPQHQASRGR